MRYFKALSASLLLLSSTVSAQWQKINDVDYVWGPFSIYNLALFSENGDYAEGTRPLMLTLKYQKPVDGRDFAISLARSWSNLGITLPEQDAVVDRLRKIMPNIKKGDALSYIALEDRGYFVLNDMVIAEEFNQDFNNAVVAVWLDPRVEIGRALLSKNRQVVETAKPSVAIPNQAANNAETVAVENPTEVKATEPKSEEPKVAEVKTDEAKTEDVKPENPNLQAVGKSENSANTSSVEKGTQSPNEAKTEPQSVVEPNKSVENSATPSQQAVGSEQKSANESNQTTEAKTEQAEPEKSEAKPQTDSPQEQKQGEKPEDESKEILPPNDPIMEQPLG